MNVMTCLEIDLLRSNHNILWHFKHLTWHQRLRIKLCQEVSDKKSFYHLQQHCILESLDTVLSVSLDPSQHSLLDFIHDYTLIIIR